MKSDIRRNIHKIRSEISTSEVIQKSAEIRKKLIGSKTYQQGKRIFTYISVGSEVQTLITIKKAFEDGKTVAVPISEKGGKMFFVEINDLEGLKTTSFGVLQPEPDGKEELIPEKDDVFIIPGVAFDEDCNRLGYGGGFYDRYLEKYSDIKKIALCFDFQVVKKIPADNFDVKMDTIITEKRILGEAI